jgi:NADH:ubiquinone oxidoreductase subunit 3 (subunit A)
MYLVNLFLVVFMVVVINFVGFGLNKMRLRSKFEGNSFECGVLVLKKREVIFRLRFYMLAVIFLVFDVELILLIPYIFSVGRGRYLMEGVIMVLLLLILIWGVFLEWNRQLLEWV